MTGQNTESAAHGWNVDLLHSFASVKCSVWCGEGEWHLGVVASRGNNSRANRHHAGKRQSGGANSQSHVWDFSTNGGSSTYICKLFFFSERVYKLQINFKQIE